MRLDKALADAGHGTRSELKSAIRQGRVTVDGQVVKDSACAVSPEIQTVLLDGMDIDWQPFYTLMLHKPSGVVSSTDEPGEITVLDILPARWKRVGLFPVGRLDKDTTGLLLLTNDGALAHRLTSPNRHTEKKYAVTVEGILTQEHVRMFSEGVRLGDGTLCRPAGLEILAAQEGQSTALVTLREGKYHQIKRMIAACGGHVTGLHRFSVKGLELDEGLKLGDWRKLTNDELNMLA